MSQLAVDKDLAHKLNQELDFETKSPLETDFIKEFKDKKVWKVSYYYLIIYLDSRHSRQKGVCFET
jgi:hypothetical protein